MGVTCRLCGAGLEHCHGTVVKHALRDWECTEYDCPDPELITHTLVIDCEVIGCECDQPIGSATGATLLRSSG